jgi:hypothetical protein
VGQRFDQLLEKWSQNGSSMLKATAGATLRTRKRGGR